MIVVAAVVAVVAIIAVIAFTQMGGNGSGDKPDQEKGITFTQSNGESMTIEKADKIVVLNTYVCDIFILLGANDKVVGTTSSVIKHEDYGAYYKNATNVGTASKPSLDTIISLSPDLIIVNDSSSYDYTQLYNSGIPTAKINCNRYDTMLSDLDSLAKIAGNTAKAKELKAWYEKCVRIVESNKKTESGAFEYYYSTLTVLPNATTVGSVGELGGIRNIFEGSSSIAPELGTIISLNPSIYVIAYMSGYWSIDNAKDGIVSLCNRDGFDQIDAVKNGKVYSASIGITSGFRCCVGAAWFASLVNPDFQVDVDSLLKELNNIGGVNYSTNLIYTYQQAYS